MSAALDRYAVAGNPVDHSLSPRIHALFAEATGQAMEYTRLPVPHGQFDVTVGAFFEAGGCGLNITLPCKQDAYRWVTPARCDAAAARAQAVNTIVRHGDDYLGYNTDGVGLVRDLEHLGVTLSGSRILLLGAGGAVQGVLPALIGKTPASIAIANRTAAKAADCVRRFGQSGVPLRVEDAATTTATFDLVINGTSAGLTGSGLDVADGVLREAVCYDMMYGPKAVFVTRARSVSRYGAFDGLGMLIEQAAEAFRLWRGVHPDTRQVRTLLGAQVERGR